jgi:hypothetical protein
MANGQLDNILQHIRKLIAAETTKTAADRELLKRFVRDQDETAFAALVHRHGPMVLLEELLIAWPVCCSS